eukprot:Partr_v1_DN24076_c1_g1_i2_m34570 putative glutathione S-transferase kappa 1
MSRWSTFPSTCLGFSRYTTTTMLFSASNIQQSTNGPPAANPKKSRMMRKDLARSASLYKTHTFGNPVQFPFNTISVQRLLVTIKEKESTDVYIKSITRLWRAYWTNSESIETSNLPDVLSSVIDKSRIEAYLQQSVSGEVKDKLTATTVNLVDKYHAYGSPWILIWNGDKADVGIPEVFFGSDRFEQIIAHLNIPGLVYRSPVPSGPFGESKL